MGNENELLYKVVYENGLLYGISLVVKPANGFNFIALSEQIKKQQLNFGKDEKKQILYGIVLRPEQKIPREFEDGTKFLLKFDTETVEKFSQDFLKKGYQRNTSFNHENDNWLKGSSVVENWIVVDKDNDKGNFLGLSVEKGDWVVGMKLSDELWKTYIETGLATGFSIDSFVKFERINFIKGDRTEDIKSEKNITKNKMNVVQKLIKLLSNEDLKLATIETDKGVLTADEFVEGNVVNTEDLELFVGEFTFEGKIYVTDSEGVIVSITDVEEEVPSEIETPAEDVEEDMSEIDNAKHKKKVHQKEVEVEVEKVKLSKIDEKVEKENKELIALNLKFEEVNSKFEELLKENEELKKQPTSSRLKAMGDHNPINFKTIEKSEESMLSAIERITKKNNNK